MVPLGCEVTTTSEVKHSLVFGKRTVEQTRGLLSRARTASEPSGPRSYYYQVAMLNRATATLYLDKWTLESDCQQSAVSRSSGSLVSDTRLLTAYHVPLGAIEPNYSVRFETVVGGPTGGWAPDGPNTTTYAYDDTLQHRWDGTEENPLLPNRLFILSLDKWAKPSEVGVRDRLRENWQFVPDVFQPGEAGFATNTVWNQGFIYETGPHHEGRDVALLRALPLYLPPNSFDDLPSGTFAVDRPAVFFGHIRTNGRPDFDFGWVTLSHTNRWPNDNSKFVPLVSLPGQIGIDDITTQSSRCMAHDTEGLLTALSQSRSTHDSLVGSSGGTILVPWTVSEGAPAMRSLFGFGVLSGALLTNRAPGTWGDPVPDTLSGDDVVLFTALGESERANIDRDPSPSGDPSNPSPAITGNLPDCAEMVEDAQGQPYCKRWETVPSSSSVGILPPPPHTVFEDGENATAQPGQFARRVTCRTGALLPGAMIGVHGGLATAGQPTSALASTIIANGGGIGSMLAVCAPLSRVSYTDNWRFLNLVGAQVDRHLDTLGGEYGPLSFDAYMSRVYEERARPDEPTAYVRPPSTKMCPPNHLLRRVALVHNGSRYLGVSALVCTPATPPPRGQLRRDQVVSLNPDRANDTFKLHGRPFSLTQMIGNPNEKCTSLNPNHCVEIGCEIGEVMHGLETTHDPQGRLTHVDALCMVAP